MSLLVSRLFKRLSLMATILGILFLISNQSHALTCTILFRPSYQHSPDVLIDKNPTRFFVEDTKYTFGEASEPFFFSARNRRGTVSIDSILAQGLHRSKNLSGRILFNDMIKHFGNEKIKHIEGNWFNYSDNFSNFFQALDMGLSASDSALMTWTGQRALENDFIYASVTLVKDRLGRRHLDHIRAFFSKNPQDQSDDLNVVVE